jgi:hypothetical protein
MPKIGRITGVRVRFENMLRPDVIALAKVRAGMHQVALNQYIEEAVLSEAGRPRVLREPIQGEHARLALVGRLLAFSLQYPDQATVNLQSAIRQLHERMKVLEPELRVGIAARSAARAALAGDTGPRDYAEADPSREGEYDALPDASEES